jgi:hypothetical protein
MQSPALVVMPLASSAADRASLVAPARVAVFTVRPAEQALAAPLDVVYHAVPGSSRRPGSADLPVLAR